jgi:hypothetical protein
MTRFYFTFSIGGYDLCAPLGYGETYHGFSWPLPERTGQQRKPWHLLFRSSKDQGMRDFRDAKAMAHTLRAALT